MRRLLLFVVALSAALGAAIALLATQKRRLAPMSPQDRREYLSEKLGSRLSDEQLDKLVELVSAKMDAASADGAEVDESVGAAADVDVEAESGETSSAN